MSNLYKLSQSANTGWDTYDSCVVVADDEESARLITPRRSVGALYEKDITPEYGDRGTWAFRDEIHVQFLGTAMGIDPGTVVCASFNAG